MPQFSGPPSSTPTPAVRNDLLSAERFNATVRNQLDTRSIILSAHNFDGTHNALEVARGVGEVTQAAGTPSLRAGSSGLFTAVSGFTSAGTTGIATVTLQTSLLTGDHYTIRVTPADAASEVVPLMCTHELVSASQVKVYCWKLSSLAGNTWVLTDFNFAIAVHSERYGLSGTAWSLPAGVENENGLIANDANRLTEGVAGMYRYAQVGHSLAGAHIIREVARAWAQITWNGTAYALAAGSANVGATVTRVAQGRVNIDFSPGLTAPLQAFHWEGYDTVGGTANDFVIVNFPLSPYTGAVASFDAFIYRYDSAANTWAAADADFTFQVHSA